MFKKKLKLLFKPKYILDTKNHGTLKMKSPFKQILKNISIS